MNLQGYKVLLVFVTIILSLFVASPALQRLLVYPQTEFFTEMWLLNSEHTADGYPYDITLNQNYTVFLGASNHLGHCAYYAVQMKFRTENQSAPNPLTHSPSSLPPLYTLNVIVADEETWESSVTFSFDYSHDVNNSRVNFNQMMFNGAPLNLTGYSAPWDSEKSRFFGNLIF